MWAHKTKYQGRTYTGTYQISSKTKDRVFVLTAQLKNGKVHNISYESWQRAVADGWFKKS